MLETAAGQKDCRGTLRVFGRNVIRMPQRVWYKYGTRAGMRKTRPWALQNDIQLVYMIAR